MITNEYGVSESIGFILILGIVVTGMGLVTLYGYPILLQEQQNANVKNMERSMISIQNEVKGLAFKSVPYRETILQVSGGTLSLHPPTVLSPTPNFKIEYSPLVGGGPINVVASFKPGELEYQSNDGESVIILENGAVIVRQWSDMTGSAMIAEPRWFYDTDTKTLVIPLITFDSNPSTGEQLSHSGFGTVQMKLVPALNPTTPYSVGGGTVTISYTPSLANNHATAWGNYIRESLHPTSESTDPDGTIHFVISPVNNLIIQTYNIGFISV